MEYDKNFPKSFTMRTVDNYLKSKEVVEYDVTNLVNSLLGILTVIIPNNPKYFKPFLEENILIENYSNFNIKDTIINGEDELKSIADYLYSIRNSNAHRTESNYEAVTNEEKEIIKIIFKSSIAEIELKVEEIEEILYWLKDNVVDLAVV